MKSNALVSNRRKVATFVTGYLYVCLVAMGSTALIAHFVMGLPLKTF
jgi:hypothetical protein